jgi:osmotically inducible lipoprotein OsmB
MGKVAMVALVLVLAGCSSQVSRERATAMGVVAGAGVGVAATGTATGAVVGGASGGVLTNVLTPSRCYRWTRSGRKVRTRCY